MLTATLAWSRYLLTLNTAFFSLRTIDLMHENKNLNNTFRLAEKMHVKNMAGRYLPFVLWKFI